MITLTLTSLTIDIELSKYKESEALHEKGRLITIVNTVVAIATPQLCLRIILYLSISLNS